MNNFMTQVPLVFFEEDAIQKAGIMCKMMGASKAMLVFDQGIRDAGIADQVIAILEAVNVDVVEFTKIVPDPIYKDINEGGLLARREKVNVVIGLGGGSSMDTAKGIYALLGNPDTDNIMDFCFGGRGQNKPMKRANALLMMIPTTSGTGSDVSTGAVITDDEIDYKALLGGLQILPHIALLDPKLDLDMPFELTTATAMDTLAHGMESYVIGGLAHAVRPSMNFNEWSDMLALEDVRMIFKWLPKVIENPHDLEARSHVKYASMIAGICMCAGGLTLGHGMAQAMGALWHIPHGVGCAMGLVPSIRQGVKLERNDQERYWRLADENRLFNKDLGGGSLLDVGIYNISYSSYIFGTSPTSINSNKFIGKTGVDESASVILSYEDGKQALLYSAINLDTIRTANILGTKGRIDIPTFSNADTAYVIMNGTEEKIHIPFEINGMEYQIREVVKCINQGKIQSEIMSWNDSIEIMKIMDKIGS